jgi:flagellar protein FlgJ
MAIDKINPAQADLLSRMAAAQLGKAPRPAVAIRADKVGASGKTGANGNEAQIRKAAQDFEAIFINQLLKSMRDTIEDNKLWGDGRDMKLYRSLLDEQLASQMAKTGGIGLADILAAQLMTDSETSE